jgi:hypothetical protein
MVVSFTFGFNSFYEFIQGILFTSSKVGKATSAVGTTGVQPARTRRLCKST